MLKSEKSAGLEVALNGEPWVNFEGLKQAFLPQFAHTP